MKQTITITIDKKLWKKLSQLELDKNFKTHDEALEYLFKEAKEFNKGVKE